MLLVNPYGSEIQTEYYCFSTGKWPEFREKKFTNPLLTAMFTILLPLEFPKGPKIEKIQDRPPGLKKINRDWNFQSRHPPTPFFLWGILKVRDWKFQSRFIFSIEIENFNRDWFFSIFGPLGFSVFRTAFGVNFVKHSDLDTQTLDSVALRTFHQTFTLIFTTPLAEKNRGIFHSASCQSMICVQQRTHWVLGRTHRVCRRTQWVSSWQAPDAPSKRITAKCTIKTYFFDLLSWGGPAFDLFNEVKRVRFDGAFCNDTFWWCIRRLPKFSVREQYSRNSIPNFC